MKKKNLNVVEEVKEVDKPIEETNEEAVDKQADLPAEVKKENFIVRGGKAVVGGIKKHGKKVVVATGLMVFGAVTGAVLAKNKFGSNEAGEDTCYDGDDGLEVNDLEPSEYTETSYEESEE